MPATATELEKAGIKFLGPAPAGKRRAGHQPGAAYLSVATRLREPAAVQLLTSHLKLWYGLTAFAESHHDEGKLLVRDHSASWFLKPPAKKESEAESKHAGLEYSAGKGRRTVLDLPGECAFGLDAGTQLFDLDEKLPQSFRVSRYTAPEVRGGAKVGPAADVYMIARVVLDLLTGRQVAVEHQDALHVVSLFRLFHWDFPAGVLAFLERCLATNPKDRPQSAAAAREELAAAVAAELSDLSEAWRPFARFDNPDNPDADDLKFVCCRRLALATRKEEESKSTFQDVTLLHDDDILLKRLHDNIVVGAVFDGVSTTDVGTGGFAAMHAKTTLLSSLKDAIETRRGRRGEWVKRGAVPGVRYTWLSKLLIQAIRQAHSAVRSEVEGRYEEEIAEYGRRLATPLTTVTAALIYGDHAVVAWVGDSPAYLVTPSGAGARVVRLTAAQTVGTMTLVESGVQSANMVSDADALTGTIGSIHTDPMNLPVKMSRVRLREGDLLVLGTDGVLAHLGATERECTAFVADAAAKAVTDAAEPGAAAAALFDALWEESSQQGSKDDRTLMVFTAEFAASGDEGRGE